jgi:small subunit ribosomal protein S2
MANIDRMKADGTFDTLSKRERLQVERLRAKLEKNLGSIAEMTRLPAALFVVDINREHIAVSEAHKLNIPVFAIVDTNTNPYEVDFPIPGNDDSSKSIAKILEYIRTYMLEGLNERKSDKDKGATEKVAKKASKMAVSDED